MRFKLVISSVLILTLVLSGCVSQSKYDNQVYENQDQRERIRNFQDTVSDLRNEINSLEDGETVSERKISRLNTTVKRLNDRVENLKSSRNSLEDQKNTKDTRIRVLQNITRTLRNQIEKLNQTLNEVERENFSHQERNNRLGQWINELNETNETLETKLTNLRNEFTQYKNWEKIVLLDERLYFETANAELTDSHRETLDTVIQNLEDYPDKLIVVVGHADNDPISSSSYSSNWELSAERATSVVEYITGNSSFDPERFSVKGRGEYERAKTESRRDINQGLDRRVEIMLVPNR